MRLVIGITGSTGVIYGIRMLEILKKLNIETHLIMSEWAEKCISMETDHDVEYVKSLAVTISNENNMAASVSSGTHKTDGMIVIPCSMKTLSSIANGYDETLVARSAGVTLRLGVVILPPVTEFYTNPSSIDSMVDHIVGKCLDQFNIEHDLFTRWGSK